MSKARRSGVNRGPFPQRPPPKARHPRRLQTAPRPALSAAISSASGASSPALHRGGALDASGRTAGRGARRYLKSPEVHAGTKDSGRPTPPPPRECRELWSQWDASYEVVKGPARHAGTASPSGAPQDFGSRHPGRMPEDSAFPRAPAAGCEDGGGVGPAPLKRRQWSLPRRRGRSGSLIRTGKIPRGKRPAPASSWPSAPDHPASRPPGSRVTASCFSRCCSTLQSGSAFSSCASFLGSTSSWLAARYQTASFAGSDPGARGGSGLGLAGGRAVTTAGVPRFVVRTMCAVLGLVARQEDSGLRDHRVRVLISNHVTPFDHNIVNLLTSCSTVS